MIEIKLPLDKQQETFLRKELGETIHQAPILTYEKAGEGNMNQVIRLSTDEKSLILKQSRPYVNKYPQVAAPIERIAVEHRFYEEIASIAELKKYTVTPLKYVAAHHLLVLEDLGNTTDYLAMYENPSLLSEDTLSELIKFLKLIHQLRPKSFPDNFPMKKLNHEHIFVFPFRKDNGFDLDQVQEGLNEMGKTIQRNSTLLYKIHLLGNRYLEKGEALLHGDFYPGSWLMSTHYPKIIDMEFAFLGDPAFDLGVMMAHLKMAGYPENAMIDSFIHYGNHDPGLTRAFCGVEILRRILGLAQLPLPLSLKQKEKLLNEASDYVLAY